MLTRAAALFPTGSKPSLAPTQPATACQTVLPVTPTKQTTDPSPARLPRGTRGHKKCRAGSRLATARMLSSRTPVVGAEGSAAAFSSVVAPSGIAISNRQSFQLEMVATRFPSSKLSVLIDKKSGVSTRSAVATVRQFLIVKPAIRNAHNPNPCTTNPIPNRHKNARSAAASESSAAIIADSIVQEEPRV
jgi:hypothetical protein